jgi:predicted RNA-binding protein with PIN domain
MAYILIDGYNLIGIGHGNLEKARSDIIAKLQEYAELKQHHITLVFDGWKSGNNDQSRATFRHVTVIYSRLGEKADDLIKRMLSSSTKPWIVVSSDREVADYAARKDFADVSSEEFEDKLFLTLNRIKDESSADELPPDEEMMKYYDDEEDDRPAPSKGNPRKLSRRHRKKMQALKKL